MIQFHRVFLPASTAVATVGAALLLSCASWAADNAAQKKATKEVDRAVHEIVAAYATTDVDKYFSYYADDMAMCCSRGEPSNKQTYYTGWKANIEKGGGVSKAEVQDLRLQASPRGDAVVSNYHMVCERRKPNPDQTPNVTYNMTEVWMPQQDGQWKVVSLTFSTAGPPPAPPAAAAPPPPAPPAAGPPR